MSYAYLDQILTSEYSQRNQKGRKIQKGELSGNTSPEKPVKLGFQKKTFNLSEIIHW